MESDSLKAEFRFARFLSGSDTVAFGAEFRECLRAEGGKLSVLDNRGTHWNFHRVTNTPEGLRRHYKADILEDQNGTFRVELFAGEAM